MEATVRGADAFYVGRPVVVRLDESETRVVGATLYSGRLRALTCEGVDPMFTTATDLSTWIGTLGAQAVRENLSPTVPSVRTRFTLTRARGAADSEPWVTAISVSIGGV